MLLSREEVESFGGILGVGGWLPGLVDWCGVV